ncbi:MAG: class I SAM-dependent methyltransferase [Chloroflexota bacterium]
MPPLTRYSLRRHTHATHWGSALDSLAGLTRACNLGDFGDPKIRAAIRDVFAHEIERFGHSFPHGCEYRKHWEVALAALTMRRGGVLRSDATVLGVGAGNEPTAFWLTNHVARVFATDLYASHSGWQESASATMLTNPGRFWPGPWNARRLVAQHMNALDLQYEDESFHAIFSSSSIEHFGTPADVRRALAEMYRVLAPGGVLSISTELRLAGPPPGVPGILMFSQSELSDIFTDGLDWDPDPSWDLAISSETLATQQEFHEAAADVSRHGALYYHRLSWSRYPHIVLRLGERLFTSIHLALRKPATAASSPCRAPTAAE